MSFQSIPASGPNGFVMGARGENLREEPRHRVVIELPFYLGTFPVTQAQFALWTAAKKIEHENSHINRPHHPAKNMDWRQANAFCEWLAKVAASEIPPGHIACLPTEAEWEYLRMLGVFRHSSRLLANYLRQRRIREAQTVIRRLGVEAVTDHAHWLILRRDRPFELHIGG